MAGSRYRCMHCQELVAAGYLHNCVQPIERLFDQRPGDLEATRGLESHAVGMYSVIGTHKADGWRAAIKVYGPLNAEGLRALAEECRRFVDLFDERVDW